MAPKRIKPSKKEVILPSQEVESMSSTDEEIENLNPNETGLAWQAVPSSMDVPTRPVDPYFTETKSSMDEAWLQGTSFNLTEESSNFVASACGLSIAEIGRYKRTLRIPEYSFEWGDFATWFFKY
jgi:hypothetical protein